MADISQVVEDGVTIFTGLTERGRDWMRQNYHETTVRFATTNELADANKFRYRAVGDGLLISPLPPS